MTLMRLQSVERFVEVMSTDDRQAELLAQEFLIGVTQFFRDPEVWDVLREKVIKPIVAKAQRNIRIWVPGCSTVEEAYSLAMLFLEEIAETEQRHVFRYAGVGQCALRFVFAMRDGADLERATVQILLDRDGPVPGQFEAKGMLRVCTAQSGAGSAVLAAGSDFLPELVDLFVE